MKRLRDALTLVDVVLDLELKLARLRSHPLHILLKVLLLLLLAVFKLNELLLRPQQQKNTTEGQRGEKPGQPLVRHVRNVITCMLH